MNARIRVLGATILVAAAASLTAGCGGSEDKDAEPAAAVAQVRPAATQAKPVSALDNAEADKSYASPDGVVLTEQAPAPSAAKAVAKKAVARADQETEENFISPGAPSDEQIASELRQLDTIEKEQKTADSDRAKAGDLTLERDGTVTVGPNVPELVARVVAGANAIAKFPYVYGGGHGSFVDTAYDCSGSLSYALAAGGLLDVTKVSGELAKGGAKGPGKWITIYGNAGHTFMVVGGLRFDTSGRSGPRGSRWQAGKRSISGFAVRHPPGL